MAELQFVDGVLARIRAVAGTEYDERAYLFVLEAVEYLQGKLDARRHVTGAELSWACRDLALERFGLLSATVLDCWGVKGSIDFGRIVYALVTVGLLSTQPGDREEDFLDVYEFATAFAAAAAIKWEPATP